MSKAEVKAARKLYDKLVGFWDDSELQLPIDVGDDVHAAICDYRSALSKGQFPPDEGILHLRVLDLSRSKTDDDRRQAQITAGEWGKVLLEKYPLLAVEHPAEAKELGAEETEAVYLGNGRVQKLGSETVIRVTVPSHIKTLEYLVENQTVSSGEFIRKKICSNPSKTIKELCERYGLDSVIERPGTKGAGVGYSTTIKDGR